MGRIENFNDFLQVHAVLLASAGLPPVLHEQLFRKLKTEEFDGGNFFQIEVCESGRQRRLLLSCERLAKHSQVFLVDHAWSFRLTEARKQLQQCPGLAERLSLMMCVADDLEEENQLEEDLVMGSYGEENSVGDIITKAKKRAQENEEDVSWLELDESGLNDDELRSLELSTDFPNLVGLSLWGNKLDSRDVVLEAIAGLKHLKAFWINANPVNCKEGSVLEDLILSVLPQLEIYNSKFTENYGKWAVSRCCGIYSEETPSNNMFAVDALKDVKVLDLSNRNIRILHQKVFNPVNMPLLACLNLSENPLDGATKSNTFEVLRSFSNLQSLEVTVPGPLGSSALEIIESLPNISELNGLKIAMILEEDECSKICNLEPRLPEWLHKEPLDERVLKAMWSYLMMYRLADEEKLDETPIWYIMDELGTALRHSDVPTFRIAPFMFLPDGTLESAVSYSLLWPEKDVQKDEECTRDYLFGIGEEKQRSARLTAWFHTPKAFFEKAFRDFEQRLGAANLGFQPVNTAATESIYMQKDNPIRVYTDLPQVLETLNRPEFIFCDDPIEADILWASTQIEEDNKKTLGLRDGQYMNQFPFEACIVMKQHLAQTIQQAYGSQSWYQATYDMESQLAAFIGDYNSREKKGKDNLWIVKPWNMARSIDTSISSYLPALIRLVETGPKICQKYIEQPALFQGKKFDLRYIVLLRSLQPLEIFLSDVFWARISNHKYTLNENSLMDFETHFTVMNYGRKLVHVNTHDFIQTFQTEHKVDWQDIHKKVRQMIRLVFEAALGLHPEMHSPKSRAIYGVDVMLDSTFEPKLLEVTYCPDCTRACKYDIINVLGDGNLIRASEFFNDVFGCLFLDSCKNVSPL